MRAENPRAQPAPGDPSLKERSAKMSTEQTRAPAAPTPTQTFVDQDSFPVHARAYLEVSEAVRERGLMRRAPWFYWGVGAVLVLALGGCIAAFVLVGPSWFQLLIAAALGILFTQAAFLAHEAAHRQILSFGPANDRLARLLTGVLGLSYSWWNSKHSRHHANPNKANKDPDIAAGTISFLETDAAQTRGFHRAIAVRQGWLFFPLLTLEGLNLHVQSYKHLMSRGRVKGRWLELSLISARFACLIIPLMLLLPLGMAFAFIGVQLAVFGVYMGASFAPNHKGMPVIAPTAKLDFFSKQVRTSRNIKGGWWATTLLGGLNYQVEHHLFPSMARTNLAQTQVIVREYCRTHNVPYTETSLAQSYAIVIEYLNRVGIAARDPFDCPTAAQFGRR